MLYVLLFATAALMTLACTWGTRRHLAAAAWNRELDAAFGVAARREMPTRPVL